MNERPLLLSVAGANDSELSEEIWNFSLQGRGAEQEESAPAESNNCVTAADQLATPETEEMETGCYLWQSDSLPRRGPSGSGR